MGSHLLCEQRTNKRSCSSIEYGGGLLPGEDEEMWEPDDPRDPDYGPPDKRSPSEKQRAAGFLRHMSPCKQTRREVVKRVSLAETDGSPKRSRSGANSICSKQQQEAKDKQSPMDKDILKSRICEFRNPSLVYPGKCQPWGRGSCDLRVT